MSHGFLLGSTKSERDERRRGRETRSRRISLRNVRGSTTRSQIFGRTEKLSHILMIPKARLPLCRRIYHRGFDGSPRWRISIIPKLQEVRVHLRPPLDNSSISYGLTALSSLRLVTRISDNYSSFHRLTCYHYYAGEKHSFFFSSIFSYLPFFFLYFKNVNTFDAPKDAIQQTFFFSEQQLENR